MTKQMSIKKRLINEPTPLIDGDKVTFVWKGKKAPLLVGDLNGWGGEPVILEKSEPGIWSCVLDFPEDAYIEYNFQHGKDHFTDPYNPRKISNGMGGNNSYFHMPGYTQTTLKRKNNAILNGKVTSIKIPTNNIIIGEQRGVHFYQPATTKPVPLMVLWDGQDYLRRMRLNIIVDNLIDQKRIKPIALVFVNNGGEKSRVVEYGCSEATLLFLLEEVLPLAKKHLNLIDIAANPGTYGVAGASMGGLMALYTGLRLPNIFGQVLSQSGAFTWAVFDTVVFDLLNSDSRNHLKIWMDAGIYDLTGLLEANRRMKACLEHESYDFFYKEYPAGHNYTSWTNEIVYGLEYLYPVDQK